ncbi:hypothetical protein KP509_20G024800 [Ceratopteris richardii]|uniref:Uncharacterized protein n=1 Tax=Ceratopteris richardii TaxID=49495 RepID=A0A8T2SFL0_CERRI|nr:hypothetical protein KP509_20G024800 [Ceratopteris richardii]
MQGVLDCIRSSAKYACMATDRSIRSIEMPSRIMHRFFDLQERCNRMEKSKPVAVFFQLCLAARQVNPP